MPTLDRRNKRFVVILTKWASVYTLSATWGHMGGRSAQSVLNHETVSRRNKEFGHTVAAATATQGDMNYLLIQVIAKRALYAMKAETCMIL